MFIVAVTFNDVVSIEFGLHTTELVYSSHFTVESVCNLFTGDSKSGVRRQVIIVETFSIERTDMILAVRFNSYADVGITKGHYDELS